MTTPETHFEQDAALWRYSIISPLLHLSVGDANMGDELHRLAGQTYLGPDGGPVRLSPETLRKWLRRYRGGGLPALRNKIRSDKGASRVSDKLADAMAAIRNDHPRWTLARLLQHLIETGQWNGVSPSRATLYRFARGRNLQRDPHRNPAPNARPFAYEAFGNLWTADFLHGPKLRFGKDRRKSYLHAVIDDCTRFVVSAGFFPAETVETLMRELMTCVRRFGIPQRFYTDNGPCYASRHLKIVCARLGVHLIHTPPYRPQGRGKVERFFRTVRDQFLCDRHGNTAREVNQAFAVWLDGYHRRLHKALDCTPLNKRLSVENVCRPIPEVADIEALFRMERRCRVYGNGCIRINKKSFETPEAAPNSRTTVYYLPWDLSVVYYGDDLHVAKPADLFENARRFDHPAKGGRK